MGFSRQEFWSGLPFPSPGDLSNPGIEPRSPALQIDALQSEPHPSMTTGKTKALIILDSDSKESTCQCRRPRFDSWLGKTPWRREWIPTPVFLPGEFHGQRSLAGYSPWGLKELDTQRFRHDLATTTLKVAAAATAAAAAKSIQSCPTLCDPIDGSPPRPWDSPGKNTGVGCHFLLQCMKMKSESEAAQSCPTLSDPMDCSLPGSSIHGIFQARVLEWGAIAFSEL